MANFLFAAVVSLFLAEDESYLYTKRVLVETANKSEFSDLTVMVGPRLSAILIIHKGDEFFWSVAGASYEN